MLNKIKKMLKENNKIALFHHINPDGDTLSSSYGLALALKSVFPKKDIKVVANQKELFSRFPFIKFKKEMFLDEIDETWLGIIGDTSIYDRIDRKEEFIKTKQKICFDHHQNNSEENFDIYWREPNWIASSLQAVEIAKSLNVKFNEEIAFHLMIGVLTDSGNFVFSLGDPFPVQSYGFLLDFIKDDTMDKFFNDMRKRTKKDIEIEKFMLNNIDYVGKVISLKVTKKDLKELCVEEKDVKMQVNRLGNIDGYNVWSLFTEITENGETYIKGSLRSNGPNVSEIASRHGGGGHIRAAGVKAKDWKEVDQIIKEINENL